MKKNTLKDRMRGVQITHGGKIHYGVMQDNGHVMIMCGCPGTASGHILGSITGRRIVDASEINCKKGAKIRDSIIAKG